jgi:hypothetical protein
LADTMKFRNGEEHLRELGGQPGVVGVRVLLQRVHNLLLRVADMLGLLQA